MFDIDATLVLSWNSNNLTHKKSSYEVINWYFADSLQPKFGLIKHPKISIENHEIDEFVFSNSKFELNENSEGDLVWGNRFFWGKKQRRAFL